MSKETEAAKLPPGWHSLRHGNIAETQLGMITGWIAQKDEAGIVFVTGDDAEGAANAAWKKWENDSGMTRAEYEQGQRALAFVRMMAASEGEPNPDEDGDSFWRCVEDAREILALTKPLPCPNSVLIAAGWMECPGCGDALHKPSSHLDGVAMFKETDAIECECGVWSHLVVNDFEPGNEHVDVVWDDHLPESPAPLGDRLPPGCTGPAVRPCLGNAAETVVYGPAGDVWGCAPNDEADEAIARAWAEHKQREQDHKVMEILRWRAGITCGQWWDVRDALLAWFNGPACDAVGHCDKEMPDPAEVVIKALAESDEGVE